jgi:hypothetical protein
LDIKNLSETYIDENLKQGNNECCGHER